MTDDVYARMRDAVLSMLPPSIPLDDAITTRITVGPPRDPTHGDMTTNAAMVLAPLARKNPRELALEIAGRLRALPQIIDVDVAGPGFINIRVKLAEFQTTLPEILRVGVAYGDSTIGTGTRVNVEYVSANPTGPMHIGHCRGAVVGDALANLLAKAGYDVTKEYYINDAGAQVTALAWAAYWRYLQAIGTHAQRGGLFRRSSRRPAISRRISDPGRRARWRNNTARRSHNRMAASPRRKSGSTSCATSPSRR